MNTIYLVLGSNIDPEKNIPFALDSLKNEPGIKMVRVSSTWRTKPIGTCCTDFLNTAVIIHTAADPDTIKTEMLSKIEKQLGRVRTEDKNAPRTIDLDIVAVNEEILEMAVFRLDHLIFPLAEIAPSLYDVSSSQTIITIANQLAEKTEALRLEYPATSCG